MSGFAKRGDFPSPAIRSWLKRQRCAFCLGDPPSEPHHFPTIGSSGVCDDTRVIPVCRTCHDRSHGTVVVVNGRRLPAIRRAEQTAAALDTLRAFIDTASLPEAEQFSRDWQRWLELRAWIPT